MPPEQDPNGWGSRLAALSPAKRALARRRLAAAPPPLPPANWRIARIDRGGRIPASFSQERMWLIHRLYPDIIAYNSQVALHLSGPLDTGALRRSLDDIVKRHEIYRTSLGEEGGRIVQRIHPVAPAAMRTIDVAATGAGPSEADARKIIEEEISRPFRLDTPPLVRWTLIRQSAERHTLLCLDHHAVSDGWSRHIVLGELMALYRHHLEGTGPPPLPEPAGQFADFAAWQRSWIDSEDARAQIEYWRARLSGGPALLDLPLDRPRPPRPSFRGGHELMVVGEDEMAPLRALAEREQVTMYMVFLAGFLAVLKQHCRADDICVGSGIANRRMPETDGLVGMLINTVVLRADLAGNPTFRELLHRVRAMTLDAYAHQEAPFDKVVDAVAPPRDPAINPLHQATFNFQNNPMPAMNFPGLEAELERPLFNGSAKFDLYVAGWPRSRRRLGDWQRDDHSVLLSWEYNSDIFEPDTIRLLQAHLRATLAQAVANPHTRLGDLLQGAAGVAAGGAVQERELPRGEPHRDALVHRLFEEQVRIRPEAVAVECGRRRLSYADLDRRANRLARRLRDAGVGRDVPVGLLAGRSVELIVGLLGILKAGGAYVPLDPDLPDERIAFMADKVGIRIAVGPAADLAKVARILSRGHLVRSDSDDSLDGPEDNGRSGEEPGSDSLAYILFTSGSTGGPRAVAVPHRAVVRLVRGQDFASMDEHQVWLHHSPLSFDASTLEIWAALCNGARLVVLPPGPTSLDEMAQAVRRSGVTSLWLTAGVFRLMASERAGELGTLSQLITGGDVVPGESARRILEMHPRLRLVNGYGPTENTTFTSCQPIQEEDLARRSIPIGRPIGGTTVHILDEEGRSCPTGIPGELWAGGLGLARGYWRDDEATRQAFVDHPELGRICRTGDLCRTLPDGRLEFLGRLDRQVKVRGVRVEPAEIEAAIEQCAGVAGAVVVARADVTGERILVAYVVLADPSSPSSAESLRRQLRDHLPDLQMPSVIEVIGALPLTPSGKVDYQALPTPARSLARSAAEDTALSDTEATVAGIWRQVLGVGKIGRHEDFFEIGGHSLAALRVLALLRDRTGVEVPAAQFFEEPSIRGIAGAVERAATAASPERARKDILVRIGGGERGRAVLFLPGGWGEENEILVFAALLRRMRTRRPCYAARAGILDEDNPLPEELHEQAERVVAAIRSGELKGPLALVGECAASTVACATAVKLDGEGEPPESVILLDPGPVSHLESLPERIRAAGLASTERSDVARLPPRVEHYYALLGDLRRQPVNCPLHIILSSRFPDTEAVRESWRPLAGRSLHVHRVPGDHHSYIREMSLDTARIIDRIVSRISFPR